MAPTCKSDNIRRFAGVWPHPFGFFRLHSPSGPQPTYLVELADDIVKESMRRGSRDNITALVVRLRAPDGGERRTLFS